MQSWGDRDSPNPVESQHLMALLLERFEVADVKMAEHRNAI